MLLKIFIRGLIEDFFRFFKIRRKPTTLQLPITSRCNSRCRTCNVWKMTEKMDIDAALLAKALRDPLFSELQTVGINGGELTLVKNIDEIIDAILARPSVKMIWMISNCLLPEKLLSILERTKRKCETRGICLGVTFSADGVGDVDNFIRGVPVAYERVLQVLHAVDKERNRFCDLCDIGCTVSKYNADHLAQIETVLSFSNIPIYFHLAVPNKRIGTFDSDDYSVLTDEHARQIAAEFFFGLFCREKEVKKKLKYWANYAYLVHPKHIRMTTCDWLYRNVTIDENLNFYLCATASDCIGSLLKDSPTSLIRSAECSAVAERIRPCCRRCIHYSYSLSSRGFLVFLHDYFRHFFCNDKKFRLKILWQKLH